MSFTELVFKLSGRIPSKKNSKEIIKVRGRPILISSKEHRKWEECATLDIAAQITRCRGIKFPLQRARVHISFTFPDKRVSDLSNKAESIMDALVTAHAIADDDWSVVPELVLSFAGVDKNNPGAVIRVTVIEGPDE